MNRSQARRRRAFNRLTIAGCIVAGGTVLSAGTVRAMQATGTTGQAPPPARQGRRGGRGSGAPGGLTVTPGAQGAQGGQGGPTMFRRRFSGGFTITPGGTRSADAGGGTPFSFDFRGADITNVLQFYARMSGTTITADKDVSGPVTIIAPQPVTLDDAFRILQAVLATRGFTALQQGKVISITAFDKAVAGTTLLNADPDNTAGIDPRNQVMTQVIPLQNVDAEAVAKELQPLISKGASLIGSPGTNSLILTDSAANVRRFLDLVLALDKGSDRSEIKIYPLKRAEASSIADIINNLYKQTTTRGRGPTQPQQPVPQPPGQQPQGSGTPAVVAEPDERTNSVLVVAAPDTQEKIARDIIARLDGDDTNTIDTRIRKLQYADAVQVANTVNEVLSNAHGGSGSTSQQPSFQSRAFGGFFGGFGQQQQQSESVTTTSSDPLGKVTADARTNSVIITASPDRMARITELIDKLDVDVPVETTTFVIPLKNAQADDMAYALGQAFQTYQNPNQNNNPFSFFGLGGNNNNGLQRQPIDRRLGQSGRAVFAPATHGVPPTPPNAPDGGQAADQSPATSGGSADAQGITGVMTPNGFVPTDANGNPDPTRQFVFRGGGFNPFGGGRGFGQQTPNGKQYGRGSNGVYSNLLQLQNNVYVTASPNGDSIVVTTTPDNIEAVKEIVAQLDVVPRQVMVEVIVAEASLDSDQKLGFVLGGTFANLFGAKNASQLQLNFPSTGSATTFSPIAPGAQFTLGNSKYSTLLQALQTDSRVKVLSTPSVFTSNNQQADIEITQQVPYVTAQDQGILGSTTISNNVQFLKIGFILNVTPRISRNGLVTIDVRQEASDLVRFQTVGTGASALQEPVVNDRYTDTSVSAQDGSTIIIGGLIRESDTTQVDKIPFLSDIPLLGQFFRDREKIHSRTELLIFLTPHVVNSLDEAQELAKKDGAPLVTTMPELGKQQPNLKVPAPSVGQKPKQTATPPPASGDRNDGIP